MAAAGRITTTDWNRFDTRHAVISHPRMAAAELEDGYDRARRDFYRWGAMARGALARETPGEALRHAAYQIGWKKLGPMWDAAIRVKRLADARPLLERVLATTGTTPPGSAPRATRRANA
jgi:hypothetical protein